MLFRLTACLLLLAGWTRAATTDLPRPPTTLPHGLGVNIHFTHPREGELEQLAAAGFTFVRMDFTWGLIEQKRGEYDFKPYDDLLAALDKHNVRALLILDYANPLYDDGLAPHTDAGRQAFAKWAAAAVTHFKGRGVLWEMWNEPNLTQFWHPKTSVDNYVKLAIEVGKAIKSAGPEEIYIGPASSTIDMPFLETCFKGGLLDYFGAVSVHPYRGAQPETVADEYRKLRQLIAQHAPKDKQIPVFSGEWGYSCAAGSAIDDRKQGQYLARQWLTNIANDVPVSIWYDWHDDGPDPKENEHHFGTVTLDYKPKPAYDAAKKLTETLRGYRFNKRLLATDNDDDHVLLFTNSDDDVMLAAWTTSADPRKAPIGDLTIELTQTPTYAKAPASAFFKKLAAWDRAPLETIVSAPAVVADRNITRGDHLLSVDIPFADDAKIKQRTTAVVTNGIQLHVCSPRTWLELHVMNPSGEPFDGTIAINDGESEPVHLGAGELRQRISISNGDQKYIHPKLLDAAGNVVIDHPPMRFGYGLPFWRDTLEARGGGDKDVKSTQSFTTGGAPVILTMDYSFDPGWKYISLAVRDEKLGVIEGKPKALGMWVSGDRTGVRLRMRFTDSTGQQFQPDGPRMDFDDWRNVVFPLDASAQGHWGGANDGVIHYPIRLDALLVVDNVDKAKTNGRIQIMYPLLVYEE